MNPLAPAVYVGRLRHARYAPRAHAFTYPIFHAFLDVDRIPETLAVSRFTSCNRWNWASFYDTDHFGDPSRPPRDRVAEEAAAAGVQLPDGPIYLLTNLRYLGYCFNPVSFYYCYDASGRLETVLAEVNNTFGEMKLFRVPHAGDIRGRTLPNFFGSATTRTELSAGLTFSWGER